MMRRRKRLIAVTASAVCAIAITGCGGNSSGGTGSPSTSESTSTDVKAGGTLHFLIASVIEHTDPQRVYVGRDLANFGRMVYRGLTAFPPGDPKATAAQANTPVPDLATNLGTATDGAKTWQFTLKDGVKWQDGKPVTCADLKYGVSRTFATDVITGGPNYIIGYLDVPRDKNDVPLYDGPYKKDHQADFDKAITCSADNKTITYHFRKPFPDFPLAIASLRSFDPYRADKDKGDKSNYQIFSNGPYMLKGAWDPDKGGTFVRNPMWDKSTDTVRSAYPNQIDIEEGFDPTTEEVQKRLIADKDTDQYAISTSSITPDLFPQITGSVKDRTVNVASPFTNYILPNFNRITNPKVRLALAQATDRQAYSQALGGTMVSAPAQSIVNPAVPGYTANPAYSADGAADTSAAKATLKAAGVPMPYPIKLTYPTGSDASNKAFAALQATYNKAGFKVTLDGLDPSGPYYTQIQKPDSDSDLIWGGWGADWPSISTVIPPLFDSRVNLVSKESNGQDYGNFKDPALNKAIDAAAGTADLTAANKLWSQIDQTLSGETGYIPLDTTKFYFIHGSKVENYVTGPGTSSYPDLANIALADNGG